MSGERSYQKRENDAFLHTDQSPTKDKLWSYQGLINLIESDSESGGFVCVPKSHLLHRKYFEKNFDINDKEFKNNWHLFTEEEKESKNIPKCLKVNCGAGDFIFWDSRTFHCNTVPTKNVSRMCSYICMIPKSSVPKTIVEKREKAVREKRCCSHHPGDGFKIFPAAPRYVDPLLYRKLINKISNVQLNELQESLAFIK